MAKRETVILYGAYERALTARAIEGGLVSAHTYPGEQEMIDADFHEKYDASYKRSPYKTATLQMCLLYDRIVLAGAYVGFDYSPLVATGLVEAVVEDDEPGFSGRVNPDGATREFALSLRDIVLQRMMAYSPLDALPPPARRYLRRHGIEKRTFNSLLFDIYFANLASDDRTQEKAKIRQYDSGYGRAYCREIQSGPPWGTYRRGEKIPLSSWVHNGIHRRGRYPDGTSRLEQREASRTCSECL